AKARASGSLGLRFVCSMISSNGSPCAGSVRKQKPAVPAPPGSHGLSTLKLGTEGGIAADTLTMARLSDPRKTSKPASILSRKPGLRFPAQVTRIERDRAAI